MLKIAPLSHWDVIAFVDLSLPRRNNWNQVEMGVTQSEAIQIREIWTGARGAVMGLQS